MDRCRAGSQGQQPGQHGGLIRGGEPQSLLQQDLQPHETPPRDSWTHSSLRTSAPGNVRPGCLLNEREDANESLGEFKEEADERPIKDLTVAASKSPEEVTDHARCCPRALDMNVLSMVPLASLSYLCKRLSSTMQHATLCLSVST